MNNPVLFFGYLICLLLLNINADESYIKEKPAYVPSCQIKDPEFTKCSTKSIQSLFDRLIKYGGIEGLENLPKVDPFSINRIDVQQSGTEAIKLDILLTNVKIQGFSRMKIVESKVSPKDYNWRTKIYLPKMGIRGNYQLNGRILLINLNGRGNMSIVIDNLDITLYTKTRLYEKGDFTFYNVTQTRADYKITKLKVKFDNLFNGQKELEDSTNAFFNQNWETLNEALQPIIQKTISDILLKYLHAIFDYVPANFLVTDIPTSKELYGE